MRTRRVSRTGAGEPSRPTRGAPPALRGAAPQRRWLAFLLALALLETGERVSAQDLEPRRWTHMPVGSNVFALSYARTSGDVAIDPLLEVEDGRVQVDSVVASLAHAFDLLGKTGRLDLILPYQQARWEGLLSGTPTSVTREGLADPWVRLSVDVAGAPARKGQEYLEYRAAHPVSTVAGVALSVMLPLGEYREEKLLNLGQNRFIFRPQVGVLHTRGPWSYELTGSTYFFTDDPDFFGGSRREQDPLFDLQGHLIRSFSSQAWGALSLGYSWGGESTVDGLSKDDRRGDLLYSVSIGFPVGKSQALKLVYLRADTQVSVGSETDNLFLSWSVRF